MKYCFLLILSCLAGVDLAAQKLTIVVDAGSHRRKNTPVQTTVPSDIPAGKYEVRNNSSGKIARAQITQAHTLHFILPDVLQAGQSATYSLHKASMVLSNPVKVVQTADGLSISINNREVFYYHITAARPPADSPSYYSRSGFIHPLRSPAGNIMTDDFPAGHAHQHGIMMAWVSTRFRNEDPDFWNQQHLRGNVKHVKVKSVREGPVTTEVGLQLQHYTEKSGEILSEDWTITVYPFSKYYLFDIRSEQVNTTRDTLFMKKYHYGGMEFRGSREWNSDDKVHFTNKWKILTDSGFTIENGNGRKAAYVSVEGDVQGKHSGVAVFSFPSNFRYPQPIRIHPEMPYWCFAPMVDSAFTIAPGEHFISGYRYYVFDGERKDVELRRVNDDLLYPIRVRWHR